jgi:hypothetical protein
LDGPAVHGDRRAAGIEKLDEVILESGTGIAAASVDLADDNTAGAGFDRRKRRQQDYAEQHKKATSDTGGESLDVHRQVRVSTPTSICTTENPAGTRFSLVVHFDRLLHRTQRQVLIFFLTNFGPED